VKVHFEDKVVVVTGASRGIGRDVALAFAREGARLVIAARSADQLAQVQNEIALSAQMRYQCRPM
jgi:short-subunit dehydrogenase